MDSLLLCWDSVLSTMWESMVISHATLRQRGRSWTEVWSGLCCLIKYPWKRLCVDGREPCVNRGGLDSRRNCRYSVRFEACGGRQTCRISANMA